MLPGPCSSVEASVGWNTGCGWGQAYKGSPVGLQPWACAPVGLPVTSEPSYVANRWASFLWQVKGSEGYTPRGAADAHPHSYGKRWYTSGLSHRLRLRPALEERETQPGQVTAATDDYHVQVSFTIRTRVQRGWAQRR